MKKFLLILSCAATVSGCWMRSLALEHSDWLALRLVDGYVDLSSKQREMLRPYAIAFRDKLNKEWLPRIAVDLEDVGQRWVRGIVETDYAWINSRYDAYTSELLVFVEEPFHKLSATMTPAQHKYFEEALHDSNAKIEKQLRLSDEKLTTNQRKKIEDNLEEWVGDLDRDRERFLTELMLRSPSELRANLQSRLQQRTTFQAAILNAAKTHAPLAPIVRNGQEQRSRMERQWFDSLVRLNKELSAPERQTAKRVIDKWIEDFRA